MRFSKISRLHSRSARIYLVTSLGSIVRFPNAFDLLGNYYNLSPKTMGGRSRGGGGGGGEVPLIASAYNVAGTSRAMERFVFEICVLM